MNFSLTHTEWFALLAAAGVVRNRVALGVKGRPFSFEKLEDKVQSIVTEVVQKGGNVYHDKKFKFSFTPIETKALVKMAASCKDEIAATTCYQPQFKRLMLSLFNMIVGMQDLGTRHCHDCHASIPINGPSRCQKCLAKRK